MRLLICTQIVDRKDPTLGFMHRWIEEIAKHCDSVIVICLKEGEHELPKNVRVFSLGKERGTSRLTKITLFFKYIVSLRGEYDTVLVHMNQEYILLAGWVWKLLGKNIYMWRNHYKGSLLTDIAAGWCEKVFCTSKYSYTAKYKNTVIMPVGVDLENTKSLPAGERVERSILSFGRMAPSKNVDVIVEALGILRERGILFTADIYGTPLPRDEEYKERLTQRTRTLDLVSQVRFHDSVEKTQTFAVYRAHEIYINASPSGMFDKMIFSALSHGCIVLASSLDFSEMVDPRFVFTEGDARDLADKLEAILGLAPVNRRLLSADMQHITDAHSLKVLGEKLVAAMTI